MTLQKSLYFLIYFNIATAGKTFNHFGHQIPQQTPFNTVSVPYHGRQRCFSICTYSQRCLAFLIKSKGDQVFICQFYDASIRLLDMGTTTDVSIFFYSVLVNLNTCADYYKAGYRKNALYEMAYANGTVGRVQCYMEYKDCNDWYQNHYIGMTLVYMTKEIALPTRLVKVRCFGQTTLIQMRSALAGGTVNFQRSWYDYKKGFGDMEQNEFWLGNEIIHQITNRGIDYKIYIRGYRSDGTFGQSSYNNFRVGPESDGYKMECATTETNEISALFTGSRFTTFDRDLDRHETLNCAENSGLTGGFWYSACGSFYPNGEYFDNENVGFKEGIVWNQYSGSRYSLKQMEIRIFQA